MHTEKPGDEAKAAGPARDPSGSPTADPTGSPSADPTGSPTADPTGSPTGSRVRSAAELRATLRRIDGRGYKSYKDLRGAFTLGDSGDLSLFIDRVQGDPFAAPSRLRLRMAMERAAIPDDLQQTRVRRMALCDAIARELHAAIGARRDSGGGNRGGSGRNGGVWVDAGGQEVLERSALVACPEWVEARLEVGLPAAGRRVLGRAAEALLLERLPALAEHALCWDRLPADAIRDFVLCVENQEHVRSRLDALGLVAFVGNGAQLPRESGDSDRPMTGAAVVPFQSPGSLEIEIEVPNPVLRDGHARESLRGMGLRKGVSLIVGGGYHGKSTLLRALERGVYPHVPGDGREWVVSAPGLVKVRAEDGRSVRSVDIHAFVRELPGARDANETGNELGTHAFSSRDASGSTSQAACITEAVEVGASGILLDEDTSATNFMVRDARMQALVARDAEPITPFLERVRELWEGLGVSTVLVMGGCGDYFEVADTVIAMRDYAASDATDEARRIAAAQPSTRTRDAREPLVRAAPRVPLPAGLSAARGRRDVKITARGLDALQFGELDIDLRGLEQLVDRSQTRAIGCAIHWLARGHCDGVRSLAELLDALETFLDERGLDPLDPCYRAEEHPGNLARPRRFEIAGALDRMRSLRIREP